MDKFCTVYSFDVSCKMAERMRIVTGQKVFYSNMFEPKPGMAAGFN